MSVQSEHGWARGGGEKAVSISRGKHKQRDSGGEHCCTGTSSGDGRRTELLLRAARLQGQLLSLCGTVAYRQAAERAAPAVSTRSCACARPSALARAGGHCMEEIHAVIR